MERRMRGLGVVAVVVSLALVVTLLQLSIDSVAPGWGSGVAAVFCGIAGYALRERIIDLVRGRY